MGKTVGIISLKGGVGKTSAVSALGGAIADFGQKVLLIDGNFSAPNLGLHLNIIDPKITLHHVLDRTANLKDAIYESGNLDVMPSSIFERININPLDLKNRIKTLKRKYDVILLDSSPALNEETLAVMLASDELLVVTTPDYPTLSMTLKAVKVAKQRGTQIEGLILNKVHNKNFELSLKDIEKTAEVPVMAVIPHDVNVLRALSEFSPSTIYNPKSKGSIEYKKLAAVLIGQKYKPFKLNNFLRITPKRQEINREILYKRVFK
ncbi:AAA family ATPase [Candidatus Pacearchaeota archaeon]|nr:AAA family ATPase [Candidatus Pacearchaeota archaeon]